MFPSIVTFTFFLLVGFLGCKDHSSPSAPTDMAVPTQGLVAYYPLDGNCGDSSGNGRHGTLNNTTIVADRFNQTNRALYFNGANSYAELGDYFNYPYFSLSLWVMPDSTQVRWADILENAHTNDRSWNIQQAYDYSNEMSFGVCINPRATDSPIDTLQPKVWQHLVCIKDSLHTWMYINGVLADSATHLGPTIYDGTQQLGLARWYTNGYRTRFWKGAMDDVRLYNRPLSRNEVVALYRERGY
ncbi:MAG: LamG domain-containing protein [bacterium]|nr:LamG domain-containing protein [bacterium]